MSKARGIINDKAPTEGQKWYNWALSVSESTTTMASAVAQWVFMNGRIIGWWIVTTGMITAVPLLFEVRREVIFEQEEGMRVQQLLAEGKTPREVAMNDGLVSAIEPKVLN